jgi:Tn3 transposase DDE domain-containing protein
MQLQVKRGEGRHQLARRLFFANQGAFQTGDYEEIMNKATCLSLLSSAALVLNTTHTMRIIKQLRAAGESITDKELARIAPLAFAHVIPNGTYFTRRIHRERAGESNGHVHPREVEMASDIYRSSENKLEIPGWLS